MPLCFLVLVLLLFLGLAATTVEEYPFEKFPKNVVALHMPCEESNMFATKCMCHIKCTDKLCNNARNLCDKYSESKGCKYMLIRGVGTKKIATLKRTPSAQELSRIDISMYNNVHKNHTQNVKSVAKVTLGDMVDSLGSRGQSIVSRIFEGNTTGQHCGKDLRLRESSKNQFLQRSISLTVLSYHTPLTLVNTMRSWRQAGLLGLMSQLTALLNDPLPHEVAIASDFGFQILEPRSIPHVKESKPNVVTIGAAFYYALQQSNSEYVLFLENDFKMDTTLSIEDVKAELIAAAGMLERGAEVVRLQSRKYQGCGTFKDCEHKGIHLKAKNPQERKRNWFAFYCKGFRDTSPYISDCFSEPDYRCFTSWDSNWTLNAVLVKKSSMLNKKYLLKDKQSKTIGEIGLSQWENQGGFESVMVWSHEWMRWKVPLCLSYNGLFIHEEIETNT